MGANSHGSDGKWATGDNPATARLLPAQGGLEREGWQILHPFGTQPFGAQQTGARPIERIYVIFEMPRMLLGHLLLDA